MNKLQILQAVKEHNGESFTSLMNHLLSHPDHDPVADAAGIRNLIAAGHLSGEGRAPNSIRMTASGEDYLIVLQEKESALKATREQIDFLRKQYEELAKLNDTTKQIAIDSRTQANIAEAKAKKANVKGTIATAVSVLALLIDIIINRREIIDFIRSVMQWL